jgi:prevent-host-death family protein
MRVCSSYFINLSKRRPSSLQNIKICFVNENSVASLASEFSHNSRRDEVFHRVGGRLENSSPWPGKAALESICAATKRDSVTLDQSEWSVTVTLMSSTITIKELHATTGEHVRRAGKSRSPVVITDRGRPVAILASPSMLKPGRRKRTILPGYEALMAKPPRNDMTEDLDAVRGDR